MANNHGEDYGPVGLQDSLAAAAAAHFPVVGIGQDADAAFAPYRVTVKGQRIAVIGATQVLDDNLAGAWTAGVGKPGLASAYDVPRLLASVTAARASSDLVVVYLHWGKELSTCPTGNQRTSRSVSSTRVPTSWSGRTRTCSSAQVGLARAMSTTASATSSSTPAVG